MNRSFAILCDIALKNRTVSERVFERLAKGEKAPAGFVPIGSGSKGYHKKKGKGYEYWYPDGKGVRGAKKEEGAEQTGGALAEKAKRYIKEHGKEGAAKKLSEEHPEHAAKISEANGGKSAEEGKGVAGSESGAVSAEEMEEFLAKVGGGDWNEDLGAFIPKNPELVKDSWQKLVNTLAEKIGTVSRGTRAEVDTWPSDEVTDAKSLAEFAAPMEEGWMTLVEELAAPLNAEANFGPDLNNDGKGDFALKGENGIRKKIARKVRSTGHSEEKCARFVVNDAVRATILCDTPEQLGDTIRAAVAKLEKRGIEIFVENKFKTTKNATGYVGIHSLVRYPAPDFDKTGHTISAELQFHCKGLNNGTPDTPKEQAHKLYENIRELGEAATPAMMAASFGLFAAGLSRLT